MALIKLGALATNIRGKLGGHTFSSSSGGATISTKYSGKKSANITSQARVNTFRYNRNYASVITVSLARQWNLLPLTTRQSWQQASTNFKFTNKIGDSVTLSGYAFFMKCNFIQAYIGVGSVTIPPVTGPQGFVNEDWTITDIDVDTVVIDTGITLGTGWFVIKATRSLSPGVTPGKNMFRVLLVDEIADYGTEDLTAAYLTCFGAPVLNAYVWVSITLVDQLTGLSLDLGAKFYQVGS